MADTRHQILGYKELYMSSLARVICAVLTIGQHGLWKVLISKALKIPVICCVTWWEQNEFDFIFIVGNVIFCFWWLLLLVTFVLLYLIFWFQLTKAVKEELIFIDFLEGRLDFPPTFKYDVGTDNYDTRYFLESYLGC